MRLPSSDARRGACGCLASSRPDGSWNSSVTMVSPSRMLKKAHLLRWRPRPPCHITREIIGRTNFRLRGPDMAPHFPYESTPRVRLSGAASHLDLFEHPAVLLEAGELL